MNINLRDIVWVNCLSGMVRYEKPHESIPGFIEISIDAIEKIMLVTDCDDMSLDWRLHFETSDGEDFSVFIDEKDALRLIKIKTALDHLREYMEDK